MSSRVPLSLRRQVFSRAEGLCEYCLIHESDTFLGLQIEHIVSEKHGGRTVAENLAAACVFCNRFKGSDIASLTSAGKLIRLFNPRLDLWHEHFRLDRFQILGVSKVGQATTGLLCFNIADRLLERQTLIRIHRYPSPAAAWAHELSLA